MNIKMLVPTRGRPDNAKLLLESFEATVEDELETSLTFGLDNDDSQYSNYVRVISDFQSATGHKYKISHIQGPRLRLGGTLNAMAVHYVEFMIDSFGFMGDDHRFRTVGWDRIVSQALTDLGTGLVYGNDLLQGEALPTAVFMTWDIVNALNYMVPPGLTHFYLDNFWLDLGRAIDGITYLPDVIIEHMHPGAGKANVDDGYADVNRFDHEDRLKYEEYKATRFAEDVRKLEYGSPAVRRRLGT